MGIILALFVFQQTWADTAWPMYGANLENTHFQKMVGAMELSPTVKWSYVTGSWVECKGAAVADVDGIPGMEVVVGSNDNKVYCFDGATGTVKWSYTTGNWVWSSPAVADVDGGGDMEIVIGSWDRKIYCLDGVTGAVKWSYSTSHWVYSSPAIANVNGFPGMEVVIASYDGKVYCLDGVTGTVKWRYITGDWVRSSPAVADVDGDGNIEVVIGSGDKKIYCLKGGNGIVKWSYLTGGPIWSSPAVADVDSDGNMEVVIGSGDKKIYCLKGANGIVEWSYTTGHWVHSSPAIADVDGVDGMEVVVGSYDGKAYCLDGVTGVVKWSYMTGGAVHRGISVVDLDGDIADECNLEVLLPNDATDLLVCLNGEDGSVLWTKALARNIHDITAADIDNDGCVELVIGTQGEDKIWALDDVGGHTDCECSPNSIEEADDEQSRNVGSYRNEVEFKVTSRGTGKMPVLLFFTPNATEVDIRLYDMCGRLIDVVYEGVLGKGEHTFIPDTDNRGIHFVVLRTQKSKKSLKMIRFSRH